MQRMGAIFVLDNDRTIVELITAILSDEGNVVRTILTSASPCTAILAQPTGLSMLDSALPALMIAAVLAYASGITPGIPVVVTTTGLSNATAGLAPECEQCLLKPVLLDDLLTYVARYVRLPCTEAKQLSMAKPSVFQARRPSLSAC